MGELRRDRLSELPRPLIFQILSFLEMRDVVSTTLLSKGWNNLWTTTPYLNFGNISESYDPEMFKNFVNRALISWKGTKILKFEIVIDSQCHISFSRDLGLWMRFALEMKVEELNLWYEGEDVYKTLQCLNSCSSLRKLSLMGCSLRIHGSLAWNLLKSLEICDSCSGDSWITEELINQILLGTPLLDDFKLAVRKSNENINIMSTSLKGLKILKYLSDDDDDDDGHNNEYEPSLDTVLKINCSNLETLEISGSLYGKCFLTNVSSLTDASLRFLVESYDGTPGEAQNELLGETLRQILPSIQHIEKFTLSLWCVEVLGVCLKKHLISPLPNVKVLKLYAYDRIELGDIMNLPAIFLNLQKLVVEDEHFTYDEFAEFAHDTSKFNAENFLEFDTNLSKSLLQLKTIEITSLMCYTSIYQLIGFLSEHAPMLEKLAILAKDEYDVQSPTYFLKVAQVLLNMPRSSPTAKSFVELEMLLYCIGTALYGFFGSGETSSSSKISFGNWDKVKIVNEVRGRLWSWITTNVSLLFSMFLLRTGSTD